MRTHRGGAQKYIFRYLLSTPMSIQSPSFTLTMFFQCKFNKKISIHSSVCIPACLGCESIFFLHFFYHYLWSNNFYCLPSASQSASVPCALNFSAARLLHISTFHSVRESRPSLHPLYLHHHRQHLDSRVSPVLLPTTVWTPTVNTGQY